MDELFDDNIDIFFADPDDEELQRRKPSISIQPSVEDNMKTHQTKNEIEKFRINAKNKYVEKLKEYSAGPDHPHPPKLEEAVSLNELSKRERNRLAAKQSRDRKKLYIELMEREQRKMSEEMRRVSSEIEEIKKKTSKFLAENKAIVGFTRLSQLENRLEKILSAPKEDTEDEINIILDSMRFRLGASGKERVNKVHECFKQIINLSLPALHRYLLWASTEDEHLFGSKSGSHNDQFCQACRSDVPDLEEKIEELKPVQPEIAGKKEALLEMIANLREAKDRLDRKSLLLDSLVDDIRDVLTPSQVARMVMWANKWRFKEEINFTTFGEGEPRNSLPCKKYKREEEWEE